MPVSIDIFVDFTGFDKPEEDLVVLDVALSEEVPVELLRRILEKSLEYAKQVVPVRTGKLKASLQIEINEADKSGRIFSDVNYSIYVELGTSKMSAKPYLIPSVLRALAELRAEFPQFIGDIIEK